MTSAQKALVENSAILRYHGAPSGEPLDSLFLLQ
jgi:hypothetical protein